MEVLISGVLVLNCTNDAQCPNPSVCAFNESWAAYPRMCTCNSVMGYSGDNCDQLSTNIGLPNMALFSASLVLAAIGFLGACFLAVKALNPWPKAFKRLHLAVVAMFVGFGGLITTSSLWIVTYAIYPYHNVILPDPNRGPSRRSATLYLTLSLDVVESFIVSASTMIMAFIWVEVMTWGVKATVRSFRSRAAIAMAGTVLIVMVAMLIYTSTLPPAQVVSTANTWIAVQNSLVCTCHWMAFVVMKSHRSALVKAAQLVSASGKKTNNTLPVVNDMMKTATILGILSLFTVAVAIATVRLTLAAKISPSALPPNAPAPAWQLVSRINGILYVVSELVMLQFLWGYVIRYESKPSKLTSPAQTAPSVATIPIEEQRDSSHSQHTAVAQFT